MNTELTRLVVQEKVTDMMLRSAEHARLARAERPGPQALPRAGGRIARLLTARRAQGAVQPSTDPCAEHAS
jgi:hypothetical protein